MIYTVVCTDINDYVNWQFELLEYSWSRIHQPGKLVRLVACEDDAELPVHKHAEVFRTRPTNVHPQSGDVYVCYNRLYSLKQWLDEEDIQGTVLIVDADVVFRSPIKTIREQGNPLGQHWVDYGLSDEFREALERSTDTDIDTLQPVTWPALIDANDLRQLMPRWIEATVSIREQIKRQESDMFAFLIAAQEQGLKFEMGTTTAFMPWPDRQVEGAPIIHYCQVVEKEDGSPLWSKLSYKPWERVSDAQTAKLLYCRDLVAIVDEFARLKNFEPEHKSDTIFIALASYCEPELIDTIQSCLDNARYPENLRFGICHQFDNSDELTNETCLDKFAQDTKFRYVTYDHKHSQGGCWARNIAQQLYEGETYTLQIDAHTQMIESWDSILIEMLQSLPSEKPLVTQCPPLYSVEEGVKNFRQLDDLSQVNTVVAESWTSEGWLHHPQKLIAENNIFPRGTRALSGGFVFTSGEWNEVVRQDPKHFYTGEEFALAVRSYTHGYDLFDPSQIVCWHRLHPSANRKYWNDNSDDKTRFRHNQAISRLNMLFNDDPDEVLGRFGLGHERTLEEFAAYSGIDCINKTLSDAAKEGHWLKPHIAAPSTSVNIIAQQKVNTGSIIDVTINLENMQPLLLSCDEQTPVLVSLFQALQRKSNAPNDLIYLELGANGEEKVYLKTKQLVSIETNPGLSDDFFSSLAAQSQAGDALAKNNTQQANQLSLTGSEISDSWKIWIWNNVARGCSKDDIFKQLVENGFAWHVARSELSHEPSVPLDQIVSHSPNAVVQEPYQPNPVAECFDNPKLQIYSIDSFLNAKECDALIKTIHADLKPSTIADNIKTDGVVSQDRTSSTCAFDTNNPEHAFALEVSARLSKVIGINPSYAEPIQAQLYAVGGEYKAHYDWFEPGTPAFEAQANAAKGGQRTWSVIVYLNDVLSGGETRFENADLTVHPKQGRVVFWNNLDQNSVPSNEALHQACPVLEGEKAILTFWYRSFGEGEMYVRQPNELIPRYTQLGLDKAMMSNELFQQLSSYYHKCADSDKRDEFVEGEFLNNQTDNVPSELIDIPENLRQVIISELLPRCQTWSQSELEFSALYGIRVYKRGTSLKMHTDTDSTHIISVILNVAQQVDSEWGLEIDDHMERRHSVNLVPGELIFYEGARLNHGRPTPLNGESYANIFLHFRPKGLDFT
jgi:prolyl 4-hydroxylase